MINEVQIEAKQTEEAACVNWKLVVQVAVEQTVSGTVYNQPVSITGIINSHKLVSHEANYSLQVL